MNCVSVFDCKGYICTGGFWLHKSNQFLLFYGSAEMSPCLLCLQVRDQRDRWATVQSCTANGGQIEHIVPQICFILHPSYKISETANIIVDFFISHLTVFQYHLFQIDRKTFSREKKWVMKNEYSRSFVLIYLFSKTIMKIKRLNVLSCYGVAAQNHLG